MLSSIDDGEDLQSFADAKLYQCPLKLVPSDLVILDGLKVSMKNRLLQRVCAEIQESSSALAQWFSDKFHIPVDTGVFSYAVLDAGLVARPEFKFPPGYAPNSIFAYVGDAMLTARITLYSAALCHTPKDHQELRRLVSSKNGLAHYWKTGRLSRPVTWEAVLVDGPPTEHQSSEFLEAVIGALILYRCGRAASALMDDIIQSMMRRSNAAVPLPDVPQMTLGDALCATVPQLP